MTTTTDREPLYQQAIDTYSDQLSRTVVPDAIRAVVDLVLDAQAAEDNERIVAWNLVARHPALRQCYREDRPLVHAIVDRISNLASLEGAVAEPAKRPDSEVLREAARIVYREGGDSGVLDVIADRLEAEHRAAQEKAAAEAEREKLIEQAAQVLHRAGSFGQVREWADLGDDQEFFIVKARALADAGLLAAPETTDGGAA